MNQEQQPPQTEVDRLTAMKAIAVNMATTELIQTPKNRAWIMRRAIQLLKERGVDTTEAEREVEEMLAKTE